eukprot:scaffold268588_cov15-Tisochrysis_lutea.AAC.2
MEHLKHSFVGHPCLLFLGIAKPLGTYESPKQAGTRQTATNPADLLGGIIIEGHRVLYLPPAPSTFQSTYMFK